MKNKKLVLSFLLISFSAVANAEDALLSITCDGDNVDAQVYVNGKLRGECPLDLAVPPGKTKIRALKKSELDTGVFEKEVFLSEAVVKRVDVALSKELTALGKQQAEEQEKQEKIKTEHLRVLDSLVIKFPGGYGRANAELQVEVRAAEFSGDLTTQKLKTAALEALKKSYASAKLKGLLVEDPKAGFIGSPDYDLGSEGSLVDAAINVANDEIN